MSFLRDEDAKIQYGSSWEDPRFETRWHPPLAYADQQWYKTSITSQKGRFHYRRIESAPKKISIYTKRHFVVPIKGDSWRCRLTRTHPRYTNTERANTGLCYYMDWIYIYRGDLLHMKGGGLIGFKLGSQKILSLIRQSLFLYNIIAISFTVFSLGVMFIIGVYLFNIGCEQLKEKYLCHRLV